MAYHLDSAVVVALSKIFHREGIPTIVWGEVAMEQYGIPTMVFRVDVLLPDNILPRAASTLQAEGWTVPTGPLPRAITGFWLTGWKKVAKDSGCLRFRFPPSILPPGEDGDDTELLIFPTSFVGLGPCPSLHSSEFRRVNSLGPDAYIPSRHLMVKSIARTYNCHAEKGTNFALMLRSWASYFYTYCNFHARSLDDAEQAVKDFWCSIYR